MLLFSRLFIFIITACFVVQANACKLAVHVIDYPPLAIKDKNGNWSGVNFDYIDPLFKEANCTYSLFETPFARGINLLEKGSIDMGLNISKTKQREKIFNFIGPQRTEVIRLVTRKGATHKISTWDQFIAIDNILIWQTGAYYGDEILKALHKNTNVANKLLYIADNNVMIDLIQKNRADGFFVEEKFFNYMYKNNQAYQILESHPLIIHSEDVYFAFSKKSVPKDIIQRFQQAFNKLAENNE